MINYLVNQVDYRTVSSRFLSSRYQGFDLGSNLISYRLRISPMKLIKERTQAAQKKSLVLRPRPPLFLRFPQKKLYFIFLYFGAFYTVCECLFVV